MGMISLYIIHLLGNSLHDEVVVSGVIMGVAVTTGMGMSISASSRGITTAVAVKTVVAAASGIIFVTCVL